MAGDSQTIARVGLNLDDGTRVEEGQPVPGDAPKWLYDQGLVSDSPLPTETAVELAEAEGIDISSIEGSGKGGKVIKADVEQAIADRDATPAAQEAAKAEGVDLDEVDGSGKDGRITASDVKEAS